MTPLETPPVIPRSADWLARQARAPLFEAMRDYAQKDMSAFHTPGHKQGRGADPEFRALVGDGMLRMDLCELPEVDNLHDPDGVIKDAQELAAEAYGAEHSFFLVNGSTTGNNVMVMTVCDPGDQIILPRNAHKSMLGGTILSGARPCWMQPSWDDDLCVAHGVTPEEVEAALRAYPEAKGLCLVHPTYFGGVADLRRIADLCHAHGKPLLVDEAHGPHFHFHEGLPVSAIEAGADMVVQSTHKIISGMTQASMLHVQGRRVNVNRVRNVLQLIQSTSPNYVLMASLDTARRQMAMSGHAMLGETVRLAETARARLNEIPGIYAFGRERCAPGGLHDLDVTKLTINVTGLGMTGFMALDVLNQEFNVQSEMATLHNVLLIVTLGNDQRDLDRVVDAFRVLSERAQRWNTMGTSALPTSLPMPSGLPEQALTPREAFFATTEIVPFDTSMGRVCAEFVAPYPPGIPILAPGEVISAEAIEYLKVVHQMGGFINGPEDVRLRTIKVVAHPTPHV
ncbi:MAG: aminotransferase class I/II-fold pyridoxal phosphate-dependent enzyme [Candidatus Sericytochromatia bacterium]|nr:aminotransferase class I/II-fold pyridoxal phosphate-dependent enzyme [Candidatus Sericytochromatia bacterium]